ncbi:TipAS antibiotic-recognition domain-containing protein, partial [Streptomyces sp. NPDC049099]|uniref:TipAS antibiotic-recognition domain-containing protein n=1 Tax=Streptomyces sp. NPDC049099 TaxID=3155768 RepID=UPI00343A677B
MTSEEMESWQREVTAQMIRMAEFMVAGTPVSDPAVQAEVDANYQQICRFWTPTAAAGGAGLFQGRRRSVASGRASRSWCPGNRHTGDHVRDIVRG